MNTNNINEDHFKKGYGFDFDKWFEEINEVVDLCIREKELIVQITEQNYGHSIGAKIKEMINYNNKPLDKQFVAEFIMNVFYARSEGFWSSKHEGFSDMHNWIESSKDFIYQTVKVLHNFKMTDGYQFYNSQLDIEGLNNSEAILNITNDLLTGDLSKRNFIVKPVDPSLAEITPDTLLKVETIH